MFVGGGRGEPRWEGDGVECSVGKKKNPFVDSSSFGSLVRSMKDCCL